MKLSRMKYSDKDVEKKKQGFKGMEERVRKSNIHLTKSQRKRQNEGAKAIFEETMRMFHN